MKTRHIVAAGLLSAAVAACSQQSSTPTTPTVPAPVTAPSQPAPLPQPEAPATARYRVTFEATWTAVTHPLEAPPNPHFSPLIGATHTANVAFWREGALASEGIRRMAEQGRTSPLDDEIRAAIAAGTANQLFQGEGISSPKSTSLEITLSRDFPLVTLVTMVAPSPDWYAGVAGLALLENGSWVEDRIVALVPWDAGTDSGRTFLSPDEETLPRQPISRITSAPLANGGQAVPLGTFRFTRIGS
jgi:hypothetical protein